MQLGNVNIGLPGASGVNKVISTTFWGTMIILVVGVIIWVIVSMFRNKSNYNTKVTLTRVFENGSMSTRADLKGGKFTNRSGTWDYRIKIPKQMKAKELGYTPDFSKADADGTLHFVTSGDGTLWQQIDRKIIKSEIIEYEDENGVVQEQQYSLLLKPIPTDIKTVTVNSIRGFKEVVNKNKLTVYAIAIGAFIIMVIAHLISLYVQTKVKCPTP